MNIPSRPNFMTTVYRALVYFAGVCVIFPVYLGFEAGFANLLATIERVLYLQPALIPSPIALGALIVPLVIWSAWDTGEKAKAFFYTTILILILYTDALISWLSLLLLLYFVAGFTAAAFLEYVLARRDELDRRLIVALSYFFMGPVMYWLIVSHS